jgi:hypothetical protein
MTKKAKFKILHFTFSPFCLWPFFIALEFFFSTQPRFTLSKKHILHERISILVSSCLQTNRKSTPAKFYQKKLFVHNGRTKVLGVIVSLVLKRTFRILSELKPFSNQPYITIAVSIILSHDYESSLKPSTIQYSLYSCFCFLSDLWLYFMCDVNISKLLFKVFVVFVPFYKVSTYHIII